MSRQIVVRAPESAIGDEASLRASGVPEPQMAEARAAMERHLAQFRRPGGARFELCFQLFTARS